MANAQWRVSGEYFEACSCDSVCPCPTSGLAARPTKGHCDAGLVFHVERGHAGTRQHDASSGLRVPRSLDTPGGAAVSRFGRRRRDAVDPALRAGPREDRPTAGPGTWRGAMGPDRRGSSSAA